MIARHLSLLYHPHWLLKSQHSQDTLTGSGVPDSSRSLTVSGKPEDSWGLCTSEGYCVILVLPDGKVGSQPSAPTQETRVNINQCKQIFLRHASVVIGLCDKRHLEPIWQINTNYFSTCVFPLFIGNNVSVLIVWILTVLYTVTNNKCYLSGDPGIHVQDIVTEMSYS